MPEDHERTNRLGTDAGGGPDAGTNQTPTDSADSQGASHSGGTQPVEEQAIGGQSDGEKPEESQSEESQSAVDQPESSDPTTRLSPEQLAADSEPRTDLADSTPQQAQQPEPDAERTQSIPAVSAAEPTQNVPAERFPESDTERTERIPTVPASTTTWAFGGDPAVNGPPTMAFAADSGAPPPPPPGPPFQPGPFQPGPPQPGASGGNRRGLIRAGITAGVVVGALALLYIGDLTFSSGKVPRGTVVADSEIGGMTKLNAERKLRTELGPGLDQPVQLQAGDASATISPNQAGLEMDWRETVDRAGSQPWNPISRVTSLFTTHKVTPVSHGYPQEVRQALENVKPQLDRAPKEGGIRFDGAKASAVEPVTGRNVDLDGAVDRVLADWASRSSVRVPYTEQPVSTTHDGVQRALREVAQPAVSGPMTVHGEGKDATVPPEAIGTALTFVPDGSGGLKSNIEVPALVGSAEPQLAETIKPGKDAEVALEGGAPVVRPSVDGHVVDWDKSFERLSDVLKKPQGRDVAAVYKQEPPQFTTDQANQLGIKEPVSEFATGGFEPASGVNIKRVAEQVNGAVVKPGETFSLNGHTGPRGVPQGYVESGIIEDGRPQKAVGGGISQFATTLYNASYFAGVQDVEHKEHSYYINRYPMGREATVFQNPDGSSVIDVKFKNTTAHGIMITTEWTPSSIKVKFWSTKQYDVTSQTSEQSEPKPPQQKVVPPGQPCSPSTGKPGFSVYDTRTLRDVNTGEVKTEKPSKTVYNPHPIIQCGPPPAPPQ